jgi:UDP-glucose 4-epimerase
MRYLVTGGAGFVGSHVVLALLDAGHTVAVLDNFSTGHHDAVPVGVQVHDIDLIDYKATARIVAQESWDAVLHFAALSLVGASMQDPFFLSAAKLPNQHESYTGVRRPWREEIRFLIYCGIVWRA